MKSHQAFALVLAGCFTGMLFAANVVSIENSCLQTEVTPFVLSQNAFSIGAWVKSPKCGSSSDAVYIYHSDTVICRFQTNETDLHFMVNQNGTWVKSYAQGVTRETFADGAWHFVFTTFAYDSASPSASKQRLYVDGVLKAESTVSAAAKAPTYKLMFCGRRDGAEDDKLSFLWSSGRLAEITYWNRALSADEVATLYAHRRVGGKESGLVSWWPLSGTKARSANYSASSAREGGLLVAPAEAEGRKESVVADDTFGNDRYVASPEWIAANGYVKPFGATFRGLDDPATSIQEAIDAVSIGETVRLLPGIYPIETTVTMTGKLMTLESYNPETGATDRDGTVLDGQDKVRVLYCSNGATDATPVDLPFLVRSLTIRRANKSDGNGGVFLRGDAAVASGRAKRGGIVDCVFENCRASNSGGAVYIYYGGYVSNCVFRLNRAGYGGAVASYHVGESYGTYLTTLEKEPRVPTIEDCIFEGNESSWGGGAISYRDSGAENPFYSAIVRRCTFKDNTSVGRGGAVSLGWNSVIEDCTFTGRTGTSGYGTIVDMRGRSNGTHALFARNTITGVSCSQGETGLIEMHGKGYTIVDCTVTNNTLDGVALVRVDGDGTGGLFRQCLFANNGPDWSVFRGYYTGSARFENCTVDGDSARFLAASGTQRFELVNTVVRSTRPIESTATKMFVSKHCVLPNLPGGAEDERVVAGDPKFTDPAKGDYMPRRTSPCRDAALPLDWMIGATDLAGAPRVVLDGKACEGNQYADIGCYENLLKQQGLLVILR